MSASPVAIQATLPAHWSPRAAAGVACKTRHISSTAQPVRRCADATPDKAAVQHMDYFTVPWTLHLQHVQQTLPLVANEAAALCQQCVVCYERVELKPHTRQR